MTPFPVRYYWQEKEDRPHRKFYAAEFDEFVLICDACGAVAR